jgi:hypothetical protein
MKVDARVIYMIPIQKAILLAYVQVSLHISPHINVCGIDFLPDTPAMPLLRRNL